MIKITVGFLLGAVFGRAVLAAIAKSTGDLVFGEDDK